MTAETVIGKLAIPFARRSILLEGKELERLFGATLAEDVEQVGLPRLQGPARQLQVVIAERDGLALLPLVVKHVDCGLVQRGDSFINQRLHKCNKWRQSTVLRIDLLSNLHHCSKC